MVGFLVLLILFTLLEILFIAPEKKLVLLLTLGVEGEEVGGTKGGGERIVTGGADDDDGGIVESDEGGESGVGPRQMLLIDSINEEDGLGEATVGVVILFVSATEVVDNLLPFMDGEENVGEALISGEKFRSFSSGTALLADSGAAAVMLGVQSSGGATVVN